MDIKAMSTRELIDFDNRAAENYSYGSPWFEKATSEEVKQLQAEWDLIFPEINLRAAGGDLEAIAHLKFVNENFG